MSRKQVVLIEWIILILVVSGLVGGGIFLIASKISGRKADNAAVKTENSAGTETAAEAENSSAAEGTGEGGSDAAEAVITPDPVRTYTFSFAGDCTIGSLLEWQGEVEGDFQSVVGTNYSYPLSGVRSIFEADDMTTVNLEGTFTTAEEAVDKPYRFKSDPVYANVLKEGSVEAVATANNHTGDFLEQGFSDTLAALDAVGILYARAGTPLIRDLEGGMRVGIVTYNTVENYIGEDAWRYAVESDIEACKEAKCDLIIGFMHWGSVEYLVEPEDWEVDFAHDMAEWGCDLIVGGHAHILQRMEYYGDVPIFYSMGNFCYGGNLDPDDKDSVIVQAEFTWDSENRTVSRTGLKAIPCLISTQKYSNDYCPTPCKEGSEDYQRILERLEWQG